jgi:hypothetical protein
MAIICLFNIIDCGFLILYPIFDMVLVEHVADGEIDGE